MADSSSSDDTSDVDIDMSDVEDVPRRITKKARPQQSRALARRSSDVRGEYLGGLPGLYVRRAVLLSIPMWLFNLIGAVARMDRIGVCPEFD